MTKRVAHRDDNLFRCKVVIMFGHHLLRSVYHTGTQCCRGKHAMTIAIVVAFVL